jgi:predicted ferric reductase
MDWRPGQFVFVRIGSGALAEPHPFTVASHPRDGVVRIMVRELGDWSGRLAGRVSVGDTVLIEGPYGALRLRTRRRGTVVWIAGGVGITPFLGGSRMRRVDEIPHLFYAVSSRQDAPGLAELAEAHGAGRIVLHLHGPATLVRDMTEGVRSLGASRVHVEKFDIRTGIGPDLSAEVDDVVKSLRHRWRSARSAPR